MTLRPFMLTVLMACGSMGSGGTGGGSAATGGGSAATGGGSAATGGGSAATGGGSAATGGGSGTGGGTNGGAVVHATTACPHVTLPSQTSVTYDGDTTGLPNWVDSSRLEWTTAPDDSLEFTAPSAGSYGFGVTSTSPDGGNYDMGVSLRDYAGTHYASCPASGSTTTVDGVFETPSYPVTLTAGQHVLMYVSAPYWSHPTFGRYTLTITKQ